MNKEEVVNLLRRSCALEENESLPNGTVAKYAPVMDRLLEDPIVTNRLLVECFQNFDRNLEIQKKTKVILSREEDKLFGFMAAAVGWCRFLYASGDNALELEHGFVLNKGDGVVLALPVLYAAAQVEPLIDIVEKAEAKVLGVVCIADCSAEGELAVPVSALI